MNATTLGTQLQEKIAFLTKNPALAKAVFRAQTRLEGGTQCTASVRKFPPMTVDEPPDLGGNDAGMNPVELLLVSLGTCQEIVYSLCANMMGIELDSVSVDVKGHLDVRGLFGIDDSVPPGYQKITFETHIETSADPKELQNLVRFVESHCPTLDTLRRPVQCEGSIVVNGKPFAAA